MLQPPGAIGSAQLKRPAARDPESLQWLPYDKAVCVDFLPAATVQQDPRIAHDGAGPEVLVLEWGGPGEELVEALGHVHRAVSVKDVMNNVSRLQGPLEDGNVLFSIQEL